MKTASLFTVAIAVICFHAAFSCFAGEESKRAKLDSVTVFMQAFLAEDAKVLEDVTARDLRSDLRKYFWLRGVIHGGDKAPVPPKAAGPIRIDVKYDQRVETLSADLRNKGGADCYRVEAADKVFQVLVDDSGKVVAVDEEKVLQSSARK